MLIFAYADATVSGGIQLVAGPIGTTTPGSVLLKPNTAYRLDANNQIVPA